LDTNPLEPKAKLCDFGLSCHSYEVGKQKVRSKRWRRTQEITFWKPWLPKFVSQTLCTTKNWNTSWYPQPKTLQKCDVCESCNTL